VIDLTPAHLEIVRAILKEHVPTVEVRAFGSRVAGKAKPHSDLDLAIAGDGTLGDGVLMRLRIAFQESDLPFRVDVQEWHGMPDGLRKAIGTGYEIVQAGTPCPAAATSPAA
jgi:predicted nucleotidyltransferase